MNRNIKDLGKFLLKKKIYIILIAIIFCVTGIGYTMANEKYVATQKILVQEIEKIETYKELIKGSMVLEKVIENLGVEMATQDLSNYLDVNVVENTNMIEIKISGEDAKFISQISSEILNVFTEMVNEVYGSYEFYNIDNSSGYYQDGNVAIIGSISFIIGFCLSVAFFTIAFLLDNKIKSCKDIEKITGLRTLISIPNIKLISKKKLNIKNIRAHKSEVFKTLMTNIQFVNKNNLKSKSILITSPKSFEGKTYVANNLAIEFAMAGKKVILIDGDMRRGRIAKIFNLPNVLGFSNYLSNLDANGNNINERINSFINDTEIKNLNVITSGNIPPNPTELLKSSKVEQLIKDLKVFYDVIIFDTVSILEGAETSLLAKVCDLSLIISAYGNTKMNELAIVYEQIKNTDGSVIGMGLNKIPERKFRKKLVAFKEKFKNKTSKFLKKIYSIIRKLKSISKIFSIIMGFLKFIIGIFAVGFLKIRNVIITTINGFRHKSENVKDYIKKHKAKREKVKLIESGSVSVENKENNVIKDVFESEIVKLETVNEFEYQNKLEDLKTNINEKKSVSEEANIEIVRPVIAKTENQIKSKFDLMREQQEKENLAVELSQEKEVIEPKIKQAQQPEVVKDVIKQQEIRNQYEELKEKQRLERERKEEEKRLRQEQINNYESIDFSNEQNLTEEMIRMQVEMDELERLAEKEEEEEVAKIKQQKIKAKQEKKKARQEKIIQFKQNRAEQFQGFVSSIKTMKEQMDIKNVEKQALLEEERIKRNEEKLRRENERNEQKEKLNRIKEEKRAFKELEKQRYKEELRIKEELQEDNLYPKLRF